MERQELIQRLNDDLAHEYQAIIMYNHYASRLTGTDRPQLVAFFREEIGDELQHAQFLADKIVALGGEPSTQPATVAAGGDNHQMLRQVLAAEERAIENYSQRLHDADSFGDEGLRIHLESMLAEETNHKEEIEKILARWSNH
jgi:bacterioferritin